MEQHPIALATRAMHIKTIMTNHLTPFRLKILQKYDNIKCWKEYGANRTRILAKKSINKCNILESNLVLSSQWCAYTLNSTIPSLGTHPRETLVVRVHQETRIAAFSITAKANKRKTPPQFKKYLQWESKVERLFI